MKRWFIDLAALALALVLMQSTAMAYVVDAKCHECHTIQEFVQTDDYFPYPAQDRHGRLYRCSNCGATQGLGESFPHEESKAATCVSGAYCDICKSYYGDTNPNNHTYTIVYNKADEYNHFKKEVCSGCKKLNTSLTEQHRQKEAATCVSGAICADCGEAYGSPIPNAHNWTEWQPHMFSPNVHYRYCQNAGCGKYETEPHDGNSNCVTSATCSTCKATYKDTTNHKGPLTYTYEKENESFHKKIESCTACGKRTGSFVSTQHVEKYPANCTHAARCNDCKQTYGDPNPDNHVGEATTKYVKTSETQHTAMTTYSICKHTVTGTPEAHTKTAAATCTAAAYCAVCKRSYGSTDPNAHNWGSWTPNTDGKTHTRVCENNSDHTETRNHTGGGATCTTAGTCTDCGAFYNDPDNHEGRRVTTYAIDPVDAYRHIATQTCAGCQAVLSAGSESHTTDKPATCMKGAHCSVCDLYYGSTRSHLMGAWQPADDGQRHYRTCEYGCGETDYAEHGVTRTATCMTLACCGDCGFFGEVDADAHDWTEWKIWDDDQHWRYCRHNVREHVEYADHTGGTATCEARAMCDVCDESYGQKLDHDYVEHEGKEPTCTEGGWYDYVTCSRCDYSGYVEKSALGHDRVSHDAKAPTCTDIGWDAYETCSRCDYTTYAEKSALGHDRVSHDAKAPTCTDIGWDAYETCSRCDYTTYVEKSALGHDRVNHDAKAPTCTTIGWDAYETCSRCDYSTYAEKSALGHDRVSHDAQEPTCTEIGWDAYETCSRCDYTTYAEKSALGHDRVSHDAQEPTCTEIGWDAYETCSRCDYTTYAEKSALGHERVSHDAQAPTCTTIGWDAYETCSRCDYTTYAEKSALGHERVSHDAQEPTCTEIGWDAYETCSRCDYSTYAEKSALGHDRVNHEAQAPTCTTIGWDAYETCSRCDYTTYVEKSALGHDYVAKTTKPTCTEKGYTTYTCTRCKDSYRDAYVAALGHWYGEWSPNADGTNSATCLRDGSYARTVDCVRIPFVLLTSDVRTELVLCPVCGEISQIREIDENGETVGVVELDGEVRLLLVEDALAKALTERLPAGELVLRMGARDVSENLLSVAFERSGKLTQPTGQVKITLPAELLDGYALRLLSEDGTETELELEADEEAETVSFVLDFTDSEIPVQVIRLVPEV